MLECEVDDELAAENELILALQESSRKQRVRESLIGDPGGDMRYRFCFEQATQLLRYGLLTSGPDSIINLLEKHRCLRATATLKWNEELIVDGLEANTEETLSPDTLHEVLDFAHLYATNFSFAPQRLYVRIKAGGLHEKD